MCLHRNVATRAGDDGFDVRVASTVLGFNLASRNTDLGIEADRRRDRWRRKRGSLQRQPGAVYERGLPLRSPQLRPDEWDARSTAGLSAPMPVILGFVLEAGCRSVDAPVSERSRRRRWLMPRCARTAHDRSRLRHLVLSMVAVAALVACSGTTEEREAEGLARPTRVAGIPVLDGYTAGPGTDLHGGLVVPGGALLLGEALPKLFGDGDMLDGQMVGRVDRHRTTF